MVGAAMTSVYATLVVPAVPVVLSVTVTVKLKVPSTVGVPESRPAPDKVRPVGSAPAVTENVYGALPPLAVNVWL